MDPIISSPNEANEYFFSEGCFILEIWNSSNDEAVSIARARVEPGVTTLFHKLNKTIERYIITDGQGSVDIGKLTSQVVNPGDIVFIPENCQQRITNTSNTDLIFLAICTPRFQAVNYQEL